MILSPLQLSSVAKSYYEGSIPKNTFGMEKYVATDGENAMFVKSDYQPAPGEVVFYIQAHEIRAVLPALQRIIKYLEIWQKEKFPCLL